MADTENKQFELGEEINSSLDEWNGAKKGSDENEREDDKYVYYRTSVEPTQENLRAAGEIEERIKDAGLMSEEEYNKNKAELENLVKQVEDIKSKEDERNSQIKTLKSEVDTARENVNNAKKELQSAEIELIGSGNNLRDAQEELKNAKAMSTKTKVNSNNLTFEQFINLRKAYDTSYKMAKNSSDKNGLVPSNNGNVFGQTLNNLNENNKNIRSVFGLMETTWRKLEEKSGKGNVSLGDVAENIAENGDLEGDEYGDEAKVLELLNDEIDIANKDIEAANAINAEANILHSRYLMIATRRDVATLGKEVSEDGLFKGSGLTLGGKDSKTYMQDTAKENGQEKSIKGYEKYILNKCDNEGEKLNQYEEDLKNNLLKNYFDDKNIKEEVKSIDVITGNVNTTLKDSVSIQTRIERIREEFESSKYFEGNPYNIPEGKDLKKCIAYLEEKRESNEKTLFMSSLSGEQQNQYNAIKSKIEQEKEKRKDGGKGKLSDREYANLLYISDCFVRSANVAENIEPVIASMTQFRENVKGTNRKVIEEGIRTCGDNQYPIRVFKEKENGQISYGKEEWIDTTRIVNDSNTNVDQTIKKPLTQIDDNLKLMRKRINGNFIDLYNLAMGNELGYSNSYTIEEINELGKEFNNFSILGARLGNIQNVVQQKSAKISKNAVEIEDKDKIREREEAIKKAEENVKRAQANFNNANEAHNLAKENASKLEAEAGEKEKELEEAQKKQKQINQTKSELETKRDELNATIKEEDKKREQAEKLKKEAEDLRKTQYEYTKREKKEVPKREKKEVEVLEKIIMPDKTGADTNEIRVGGRSDGGKSDGNEDSNTGNGNNKIHIGMADGTGDAIENWNSDIDYMANLYSRLALNDSNSTTRAGIYVSNIEQANRELVERQMSFISQNNLTLGQVVGTFYNGQNINGQEELTNLMNLYPNTSINDLMRTGLLSQDNVRSLLESTNNDLARAGGQALNQGRQTPDEYNERLTANTEASHSATITATYLQANGGNINLRDVINNDDNLENRLNGLESNFNDINSKLSVTEQAENIRKTHPKYTQTMTDRVRYGEKINKFNSSHYKSGNNLDPSNFSEGYKKATEAVGAYMVYDKFEVKANNPEDPNSPAEVTIQADGAKSGLTFESKYGPFNTADFANYSGRYKGNLDAFIKIQERNMQNMGGEEAKNAPVCSMDNSFKIGGVPLNKMNKEQLQAFMEDVAAQYGEWKGVVPPSVIKDLGMHIDDPELGVKIVEIAENVIEGNGELTDEQKKQKRAAIKQAYNDGRGERTDYILQHQLPGYNTKMPDRQEQTSQQPSVQQPPQQLQPTPPIQTLNSNQQQPQPTPTQSPYSNQEQSKGVTIFNNGQFKPNPGKFKPNPGNMPHNPNINSSRQVSVIQP